MTPHRRVTRWLLAGLCCWATPGCSPRDRAAPAPAQAPDSALARAIAADRGERLVMPLAPAGSGRVTLAGVAERRADLASPPEASAVEPAPPAVDWAAPSAEPALAPDEPRPDESMDAAASAVLKPPIPRGAPVVPRGGRGGEVTLDVRVDETGAVTDVELVASEADSATVEAAMAAAFVTRYHPALLAQRRVAVWTRQVFVVKRGR